MTALARIDSIINNAELNGKPEVAAALRLVRDDVAALTDQAQLVPVVGADALNARRVIKLLLAIVETPEKCSPDFPAYAVKRAREVLAAKIAESDAAAIHPQLATAQASLDRLTTLKEKQLVKCRAALAEIMEITARKQLPITAQIHECAREALK